MNILEQYDQSLIFLSEPETNDNENYYCNITYNDSPFIIQTNRVCYSFKEINDSICISLASQDYALWIESLYKYAIELIFNKSSEWFDEELSFTDIENSFLSPLKSNIQKGCYDINCSLDKNNLIIIDNKGRIVNKSRIKNYKIVPTIHIKGITFNSKNFMLDILLKSVIVLDEYKSNDESKSNDEIKTNDHLQQETNKDIYLEENESNSNDYLEHELDNSSDEDNDTTEVNDKTENDTTENDTTEVNDTTENDTTENDMTEVNDTTENDMTEVKLDTIESDEVFNISNNDEFANIYEIIDRKINEDILEHLKITFMKKKIRVNIDLNELFEEDIESDTD